MINPIELEFLTEKAAKYVAEKALESARTSYEEIYQKAAEYPPFAIQAAYSLASFHWGDYGDGVEAKAKYEIVMSMGEPLLQNAEPIFAQSIKTPLAYAAENLMLLSTSYEEFEKWTQKLTELAPDEPILKELVPVIRTNYQSGIPWAEEMKMRGMTYINLGHFGTSVHPASGACVFHLMIVNRKNLRMQPAIWQQAVLGYMATITEIGDKAEKAIRARRGNPNNELSRMTRFLVPFTKDYCDSHPSDEAVRRCYLNAQKIQAQYDASNTATLEKQNLRSILPEDAILKRGRCAKCTEPMILFLGQGIPGRFSMQFSAMLASTGIGRGSFRCKKCNRSYCYEHSNSDDQCKCGATSWATQTYFVDDGSVNCPDARVEGCARIVATSIIAGLIAGLAMVVWNWLVQQGILTQ